MIPIDDLIESLSEAECKTLEEMSQHHRYSNFQLRARGLLALNAGHSPVHTLHEGNVTRDDVVSFVDKLAQQHSQAGIPIIVVLDNASIHCHIDDEKKHKWLMNHKLLLWHIPPYSPELNLIEILWKHAKYHWRKFTSWTQDQLVCEVNKISCEYGNEFKIDYARVLSGTPSKPSTNKNCDASNPQKPTLQSRSFNFLGDEKMSDFFDSLCMVGFS